MAAILSRGDELTWWYRMSNRTVQDVQSCNVQDITWHRHYSRHLINVITIEVLPGELLPNVQVYCEHHKLYRLSMICHAVSTDPVQLRMLQCTAEYPWSGIPGLVPTLGRWHSFGKYIFNLHYNTGSWNCVDTPIVQLLLFSVRGRST